MVGCVIVKDDKIIGEGYHEIFGGPHAEINAIQDVGDDALIKGSTIYISLEPCTHFGKTPPCALAILALKPKRVVIGSRDTNPSVAGKGIERLKREGIEVTEGILEAECRLLNKRFFTFHEKRRPYVILK